MQHETTPFDQKFWTKRGVDIKVVDLLDYVRVLDDVLRKLGDERRQG